MTMLFTAEDFKELLGIRRNLALRELALGLLSRLGVRTSSQCVLPALHAHCACSQQPGTQVLQRPVVTLGLVDSQYHCSVVAGLFSANTLHSPRYLARNCAVEPRPVVDWDLTPMGSESTRSQRESIGHRRSPR